MRALIGMQGLSAAAEPRNWEDLKAKKLLLLASVDPYELPLFYPSKAVLPERVLVAAETRVNAPNPLRPPFALQYLLNHR
jgi:hypothetical protein